MGTVRFSRRDLSAGTASSNPSSSIPTTSTSITETVNGSHEFKVDGYSLSKGTGIGKYVASDTFYIGGYAWAIYFYPDGKSSEDNASYVSLFIALASEGTDVRALFELTLMDQSGKERHKVHSHFGRALESGPYTLKYRGSMWGYKRFYKRTQLESSDFLKDDTLLIRCCVGVVKSHTEGPKTYTIALPPSNIGQHFGKLLESGKGTDVNFEVDGEIYASHKIVLAARSPVFRAQLFGPMKDQNTQCIKVEDMEAPVFKVLVISHVSVMRCYASHDKFHGKSSFTGWLPSKVSNCGTVHKCTCGFISQGTAPILTLTHSCKVLLFPASLSACPVIYAACPLLVKQVAYYIASA
ncbi:hypothetical protein OIU76_014485 [Salix suchowensis]|nr:hypothetical protein OIU76_014485 [Salix suchowensis]